MANRYAVRHEGRLVVERWWGEVTQEEILAHERAQLQDLSIQPTAVALADLRAAEFPGEATLDLRAIAALHEHTGTGTRIPRYALVTQESSALLRTRQLESEMAAVGVKLLVFTSMATACAWLGVDPVEAQTILDELEE